jgi:hypothetical protein
LDAAADTQSKCRLDITCCLSLLAVLAKQSIRTLPLVLKAMQLCKFVLFTILASSVRARATLEETWNHQEEAVSSTAIELPHKYFRMLDPSTLGWKPVLNKRFTDEAT